MAQARPSALRYASPASAPSTACAAPWSIRTASTTGSTRSPQRLLHPLRPLGRHRPRRRRDRPVNQLRPRGRGRQHRAAPETASSCSPATSRPTSRPGQRGPSAPAPRSSPWSARTGGGPSAPAPTRPRCAAPPRLDAEPLLDSLDEGVRVVSVPSVHWVDGSTVELERVAERAREVGAVLVVTPRSHSARCRSTSPPSGPTTW